MIVFEILCVMLLNININKVWTKNQAATQTCNEILEDDVEDLVNNISQSNESDPLELNNIARKVKRYENLQPHLQNLNPHQWKLLKEALNNYVIGNITEEQLGDLLPTILLPDEDISDMNDEEKQNFKSCLKNKRIYKNESSFDEDNSFEEDLVECTNTYMNIDGTTSLITHSTQISSTENYSKDSKYDKNINNNLSFEINKTSEEFLRTDKSFGSKIKKLAVPLMIDLIKSYKEEKLADRANSNLNVSSLANDGLISKKTLKREEEKSDLIDILRVLTVIANMTYAQKPKPVLRDRGTAPLCPYTWGSMGTSPRYTKPFHEYFDRNKSGDLVTMCYVCGLEETKIPESTLCEDAFSRDDFTLKEYTYKFKRYCRYDEYINNYCVHTRDKRSVWGHWTGGCSMRKIDISGVYTQRTCRNREWPTRGHHFASHRMARLEYVLDDVDDGCTVSPGASLVPLSRSISLFARFIACVCPDELCNSSVSLSTFSYLKFFPLMFIPITVKAFI